MTPQLSNKNEVLLGLGDLWSRAVIDEQAIRMTRDLAGLTERASVLRPLQAAQDRLTGELEVCEEHLTINFDPGQVIRLGTDLQVRILTRFGTEAGTFLVLRRPLASDRYGFDALRNTVPLQGADAGESFNLLAANSELLFFPVRNCGGTLELDAQSLRPRYLLPIPTDISPVTIRTTTRDMVAGLDFTGSAGMLTFDEAPQSLFPDHLIQVRSAVRRHRHLFSYTWQVDGVVGNGQHIATYLRARQTAPAFQAAIAEAAGLVVLPWTSELREATAAGSGVRYCFEAGDLVVDYPHTPLVPGALYSASYIIGEAVKVRTAAPGLDWYRCVSWENGLSLDGLCPVPGLRLLDAETEVRQVSAGPAGLHVRFELAGGPEANNAFWTFLHLQEARTGRYLNATLQLEEGGSAQINPLEFYFEQLLGHRGMLVILNSEIGDERLQRARAFIQREKPIGAIPIIVTL